MSPGPGQEESHLAEQIFEAGYRFDFFQLVHLLEHWRPGRVPVGGGGRYQDERLRFRPDPGLDFSPADVRRVESEDGEPPLTRVVINFMGLYGVAAPTPTYLSELIGFANVDAEPLTDFLDLFNHRLISLYYRAWVKHRYPYRYQVGARDELSRCILSFIGLGEPAVSALARLPVWRLMKYLGLLALQTRPPVCLGLMIADYFGGIPVEIEEMSPRWIKVPEQQRNRLGEACSSLGSDLTVGERVLDRAGKLRVVIGPLSFADYQSFLPGTGKFRDLNALVRLWVGERLDYDFEIRIDRHEIPPLRMSAQQPPQMGWTSWVLTGDDGLDRDPAVVFQREQYHA
jgi:type VI secretion system protein ImpH